MANIHASTRLKIALLLITFATILLVSQQWGMMFSNSDDPWLARATWSEIQAFASSQKRFWMLVINAITTVPYQLGGWTAINITKILINSATLFSFGLFLQRLINIPFSFLCVLVWLAFIDVSNGYYSPFHGYVLMFNLPMCLLFLSLWWYTKYLDENLSTIHLLGIFSLFGLSLLAYEPMIFFGLSYPGVAFYRYLEGENIKDQSFKMDINRFFIFIIKWIASNYLFFMTVGFYVSCYFLYRKIEGAGAGGLVSLGEDWTVVVKTMLRFSLYGFRAEFQNPLEYTFNVDTIEIILKAMVYGLLVATSAWFVIPLTARSQRDAVISKWVAIGLLMLITFSLNSLHALNEGYRQWAADNPYYIGNYLSSFSLAMLVSVAIMTLVGGSKAYFEKILFVIILAVFANSGCSNMLKWTALAERNRQDAQLWARAIDDLKATGHDASISSLLICAKHAPEKVSGDDRFWSYELSRQLGISVVFHSKNFNNLSCDINIDFNHYRINN
jgi:hypothetical protein